MVRKNGVTPGRKRIGMVSFAAVGEGRRRLALLCLELQVVHITVRMWLSNVVFPLPRKPVRTVTGTRVSSPAIAATVNTVLVRSVYCVWPSRRRDTVMTSCVGDGCDLMCGNVPNKRPRRRSATCRRDIVSDAFHILRGSARVPYMGAAPGTITGTGYR